MNTVFDLKGAKALLNLAKKSYVNWKFRIVKIKFGYTVEELENE